jgi:hypothetical protein
VGHFLALSLLAQVIEQMITQLIVALFPNSFGYFGEFVSCRALK